ncbi:MAG: hypothetical protein HW383_858, partial [Candidatus Magasanikbacteria bacterium]|nr:hypothetical protein [Candidatus Magasanikbacteria bacterium]
ARLLWKHWYQLNPPQHTALFNHENLKKFLAKHGFQVILSENIKKQFSIKYFLHTLGQWLGIKLPSSLYNWGGAKIFSFPFKDNMLVLAKKL